MPVAVAIPHNPAYISHDRAGAIANPAFRLDLGGASQAAGMGSTSTDGGLDRILEMGFGRARAEAALAAAGGDAARAIETLLTS